MAASVGSLLRVYAGAEVRGAGCWPSAGRLGKRPKPEPLAHASRSGAGQRRILFPLGAMVRASHEIAAPGPFASDRFEGESGEA